MLACGCRWLLNVRPERLVELHSMARFHPSLPRRQALGAGDHAELDLLATLERGLSDAYTLFHSVDWALAAGAYERHGEIDIVLLNQAGDILLLEVKAGALEFRDGGLIKHYRGNSKDVLRQVSMQYSAIRERMAAAGLGVRVHHMLLLPHQRVLSGSVNWPRDRLIDSSEIDQLVSRVMEVLPPGVPQSDTLGQVQAFFENRFRVEPDVSALVGRLQQVSTRMSAGLATWVPRMEVPGGVVRVLGTAGSGKTQLALRELRDADAAGKRTAYVCFNRPLADHMARVAPVRSRVETFHEMALRLVRDAGLKFELDTDHAFQRLVDLAVVNLQARQPDLDLLVIDEVQDLQAAWVEALVGRLRPQGRALLLEDPAQRLYEDREHFDILEAVTVRSHENFRSPQALVQLVNGLALTQQPVDAHSPWGGELPDPIVYADGAQLEAATAAAVQRCLDKGFVLQDIAVVSLKGRGSSGLQGLDRLGAWQVQRFTGQFDEAGAALWSRGDLLIESVRRFKGQAAPAVVLTECDLPDLLGLNARLLFVGLTRASLHLEWVVSQRFAGVLEARLNSDAVWTVQPAGGGLGAARTQHLQHGWAADEPQ